MKNILSGGNFGVLMLALVGCFSGVKHAFECVEYSNSEPVKMAELVQDFSSSNGLALRNMEGSLTIRQKEAGKEIFLVEGRYEKFVFYRAEEGVTSICAYDESAGAKGGRVRALMDQLKVALDAKMVVYTSVRKRPD